MRVPARWMLPALAGQAMLIGFAMEHLVPRSRGPGRWLAFAPLAVLLADSIPVPMKVESVSPEPDAATLWLASQPWPSPVIELPAPVTGDNRPLLNATWHRQPTANGNNGYFPAGYPGFIRVANGFPARAAIAALRQGRVRYVVYRPEGDASRVSAALDALVRTGAIASWAARGDACLADLGPVDPRVP